MAVFFLIRYLLRKEGLWTKLNPKVLEYFSRTAFEIVR